MTANAMVLMYHRIADLTYDPWQIAVSPGNFEQQLQILKKNYNLISVEQLLQQLVKKSIAPKSVCITFDDGYRDNYLAAKPLLEKYDCPAAFFIATHYINRQKNFWWDELERIILGSKKLPPTISITFDELLFEFELENNGVLTDKESEKLKTWVPTDKFPTQRCELYLALYQRLKRLPYNEQQSAVEKIKLWGNFSKVMDENLPMTGYQLKELANHPLFDVGLHTATHPFLSARSREIQLKEITDCENYLQDNCKKVTRMLAYPHGDYNSTTLSVVREKTLTAAFTTLKQPITKHSNLYNLGRFQVNNWNGEEFKKFFGLN